MEKREGGCNEMRKLLHLDSALLLTTTPRPCGLDSPWTHAGRRRKVRILRLFEFIAATIINREEKKVTFKPAAGKDLGQFRATPIWQW
jgi:hypothetical protein